MKLIFTLIVLLFLINSCNTTFDENSMLNKVDTTAVLRKIKETDEIFSPYELDSIYKKLKTTLLVTIPKEWEMLTEKNKELVVLIPGGGDNHRFFIVDSDSLFLLRLNGMHDAAEYLITDFTSNDNGYQITYYATTTWTYGNNFIEGVQDRNPLYQQLYLNKPKSNPGKVNCNFPNLVLCNFPKGNTYYVNAEHKNDFPKEEEPNPYDEDIMMQ